MLKIFSLAVGFCLIQSGNQFVNEISLSKERFQKAFKFLNLSMYVFNYRMT